MMKMYIGLHAKYPFFMSDFKESLIFSTDFSKTLQISSFMKIRPVEAELFHAEGPTDRQTDMTKPIVAVRSVANASENILLTGIFDVLILPSVNTI